MRNAASWQPSKYVSRNGALAASRDPREVGLGSRLIVDLIAQTYDRHLRQHATGRMLDLGCGKVPFFGSYRDCVSETTCVDWPNSLHGASHLDHEFDLTQPLPLASARFDTILLSDVLEHIPTPDQLWGEIARLLAPGGKVLVNVPFFYWLHEEPHDFYRYTEHALKRFVAGVGLDLVHLESVGGVPEVMTDIFAKTVLDVPVIGRPIASVAQWMTLGFVRSSLGGKVSRRTCHEFPLAYFLIAQKRSAV